MAKKIRFSAKDRDLIRKHAIGKPTGVTVELGGVELDLVPLTTEQAGEVFSILDAFSSLQKQADEGGVVNANGAALTGLIGREGQRIKTILHSVMHESAIAGGAIVDEADEAAFEEWFVHLPLLDTVKVIIPKILDANGLGTLLGNPSTPTMAAPGAAATP